MYANSQQPRFYFAAEQTPVYLDRRINARTSTRVLSQVGFAFDINVVFAFITNFNDKICLFLLKFKALEVDT